jgi:phenylacetate-CoA ligase
MHITSKPKMDIAFFDTTQFHFDDPDIRRFSAVEYLGERTETMQKQLHALRSWTADRDELKARFYWDRERLNAWKLKRLATIVDFAFENTRFYHRLYESVGFRSGDIRSYKDFERLPSISRNDLIREFPYAITARSVDLKACYWSRTSGSSGKPVQVVVDQRRGDLDIFFKYRQFGVMRNLALDPDQWIYNVHHTLWWYTSFAGRYPVFTLAQECPPEKMLAHIARLRPIVVSTLPSVLPGLAGLGQPLADHGVRLVATNSEASSPGERREWEKVFHVPVRDEYSSEELDILGHQCHLGTYHLLEDDCHVECLDPDADGVGHVVGTNLWTVAMPIIRYHQGDLISIDEHTTCACGSGGRIIRTLHGRTDQAFISRLKGRIASGNLMEICDVCLTPEHSGVYEYRLVQFTHHKVALIYVLRPGAGELNPAVVACMRESLERLFGYSPQLELRRVDSIPSDTGFKRRTILCKVGTT